MTDSNVIQFVPGLKVQQQLVDGNDQARVVADQDGFRRRYLTRHGPPLPDTTPSDYVAPSEDCA